MGHLCLREQCEGKQEVELHTGDTEYMLRKALETEHPSGRTVRGTWRGAPVLRTLKVM